MINPKSPNGARLHLATSQDDVPGAQWQCVRAGTRSSIAGRHACLTGPRANTQPANLPRWRRANRKAEDHSLLDRLAAKGHVAGDRSGFAHRYVAKIDRHAFVGEQLRQLADTHFGGSLSPMLLTLVDLAKLKKSERDAIRKIVDGME
jgi:hypothetical protein